MKFLQNILGTYMHLLHIKFSKFLYNELIVNWKTKIDILPWSKVKERIENLC